MYGDNGGKIPIKNMVDPITMVVERMREKNPDLQGLFSSSVSLDDLLLSYSLFVQNSGLHWACFWPQLDPSQAPYLI